MRKLDRADDWVTRSVLRRSLEAKDRRYFEDALTALVAAGQVIERTGQTDHAGHEGTEYRRPR